VSEPAHGTTQLAIRAVDEALRAGARERAFAIAEGACSNGAEHFVLLTLAAQGEIARGNPDQAIPLALKARSFSPRNDEVLNTLGVAYAAVGRFREALAAFEAAVRETPGAWPVRFNKAAALEELQKFGPARTEFERVLEAQPRHTDSMARLASLAVQRGDTAEGRRRAEQALRIDPSHRWAKLALAAADIQDGRFEAARALIERNLLRSDPDPKRRYVAQSIMGDALDGLGRTGEAFACYLRARESLLAPGSFRSAGQHETAAMLVRRLTNYFDRMPEGKWHQAGDAGSPSPAHVFVVGFPRSGTTLMGQILAGHPDVEVMEERSCLTSAQESFTIPPDGLDRLAAYRDGELTQWRDDYWKRVAEEGLKTDRKIFVDKMPFYCLFLCLIAKLFPRAKILFLIRDPRDVVLSCLRQRFVMTEQMCELASLEAAAAHYDAVMSLCEIYRHTLGLEICDIRQEDLVGDFETETRRICSFLDLEWRPGLEDFARNAAQRSIRTPSGPQLARGLATDRRGQWRRYREQLAPAMPRLTRWIERFGYERE
jgi:Flp pilus assembly protein TadD